ncbi:MAG: hypothetical protein RLZZ185_1509 [Bacteroidota bacterium]
MFLATFGLILELMIRKLCVTSLLTFACSMLRAQSQEGLATFYHDRFWGSRTTSGEPYHPYVYSAAHRTFPFGTWVEVELIKTGQKTIVKVNDRGPYMKGGVIDLSKIAAKELGVVAMGRARVKVRALGIDELTDSLKFALFSRDSLAKVHYPKPLQKSSRKKKSRKRKKH